MMELPASPFWDFSLEVYAKPGVAQACLALQDECGVDVNLLLFCCWAGPLDEAGVRRAIDAVAHWQTAVVQPLRAVRRLLKADFERIFQDHREVLRQAIKTSELDAEHIEQVVLGENLGIALSPQDTTVHHAVANLANYFAIAGLPCGEHECRHLAIILAASFPQLERAAVDRSLVKALNDFAGAAVVGRR